MKMAFVSLQKCPPAYISDPQFVPIQLGCMASIDVTIIENRYFNSGRDAGTEKTYPHVGWQTIDFVWDWKSRWFWEISEVLVLCFINITAVLLFLCLAARWLVRVYWLSWPIPNIQKNRLAPSDVFPARRWSLFKQVVKEWSPPDGYKYRLLQMANQILMEVSEEAERSRRAPV